MSTNAMAVAYVFVNTMLRTCSEYLKSKYAASQSTLTSIWKSSPAPSQSLEVMIGVWMCAKPFSWKTGKRTSVGSRLAHPALTWPHLEIRVNGPSGLAAYPQQGAEGVCSAAEVRELADVLQRVALFDFKREILEMGTRDDEWLSIT